MDNSEYRLKRIEKQLNHLAESLEKSGFFEYMLYIRDRSKILMRNFLSGLMRGLGMAIGFTILGALIVVLLRKLAASSIPYIAELISKIIEIIENGKG